MTLVAGFKCRDGFVIGADTEITYGPVNYQGRKLFDFHGSSARYDLVMGGAGDTNYIAMAAEKIRDAVQVTPNPTVENIKRAICDVILEVHERNLKYWDADAKDRPTIDLIIGIKDKDDATEVLVVDGTSVSEVDVCECIGSGSFLAAHWAEKLIVRGLSTAVTEHLVQQIFREIKGKGKAVGGNTQITSVRAERGFFQKPEYFFKLDFKRDEDRFLWGLEDALLSAVRDALDISKPQKLLDERIAFLGQRLQEIRASSIVERKPCGPMQHLTEYGTEYGSPFKDL